VAAALKAVRAAATPGVSTLDLDLVAETVIRDGGGTPSFLGYHGFPASICSSINDEIVHGIPSKRRILKSGRPAPADECERGQRLRRTFTDPVQWVKRRRSCSHCRRPIQ
jgi:Xaa-Pro aminopeptidase